MIRAQGFANINVGKTGTGKTTVSKYSLINYPNYDSIFVYDVNNEYSEFYESPTGKLQDIDEFMIMVKQLENSYILFEEATIFFETRSTDKILKDMLVRKRHTNNIITLNFHSIAMIPKYVFSLVNYVTVFKTIDNIDEVKRKYNNPNFLRAFQFVNNSDNPYKKYTVDLYK